MEATSGEGRMLPFDEARKRYFPDEGQPLSLLLSKKIPIYLQVDQFRYKVYRSFKGHLPSSSESKGDDSLDDLENGSANALSFDMHGFSDDLMYLRLDDASLAELGRSGLCQSPRFSEFGLSIDHDNRPKARGQRKSPRVIDRIHDLKREEFYAAFLIDRAAWGSGQPAAFLSDPSWRSGYVAKDTKVATKDIFLDLNDVLKINQQMVLADFPYSFGGKMPGIYWIFQAAHHFNGPAHGGEWKVKEVAKWLKENGGGAFSSTALKATPKFARIKLNRSQGGKPRRAIDLEDIRKFDANPSDYVHPFAGKCLSMILAIADMWSRRKALHEDDAPVVLAKTFMKNGFEGLEVGGLVELVGGAKITSKQNADLVAWAVLVGMTERNVESFD